MEALTARHPQEQWRWLDIEDEAALMDAVGLDIETFPTVLLGREGRGCTSARSRRRRRFWSGW